MTTQQSGMTLIEILVILLVVSVGMAATAKFQGDLLQAGADTKARMQGLAVLQNQMEQLRIRHGDAVDGTEEDIAGSNADYDVSWLVADPGLADTREYTAGVSWKDAADNSQSVTFSTLLYADPMLGGGAQDNDLIADAAHCVFVDCLPGEPGPDTTISNDPEAEKVIVEDDSSADVLPPDGSWPGIDDPESGDAFGKNDNIDLGDSDDNAYLDKGSNKDINLGNGDNTLYVDGNSNDITAGSGDDQVEVEGNTNGNIDLGDGDNKLLIDGNINGNISLGSGDDEVLLDGNATGILIYLGDGNNYLELDGNLNSELISGSGNDWIEIDGNTNGAISTGDGIDLLAVDGNQEKPILMGGGDDYLFLEGKSGGGVEMGAGNDFVCLGGQASTLIDGGLGSDTIYLADYDSGGGLPANIISFENIRFKDGHTLGDANVFDAVDFDADCELGDFRPDYGILDEYYRYRIDFAISVSDADQDKFSGLSKDSTGAYWLVYLEDRWISDAGYQVVDSDDNGTSYALVLKDYKGSSVVEQAFALPVCADEEGCSNGYLQGKGSFTLKTSQLIPGIKADDGIEPTKEFSLLSRWHQQDDNSWVLELQLNIVDK